jgi:hypothetical protein
MTNHWFWSQMSPYNVADRQLKFVLGLYIFQKYDYSLIQVLGISTRRDFILGMVLGAYIGSASKDGVVVAKISCLCGAEFVFCRPPICLCS